MPLCREVPYITLRFNTDTNYLLCEFMEAVNIRVKASHLERNSTSRFITNTSPDSWPTAGFDSVLVMMLSFIYTL
jgi:hypothetical protein